MGLMPWNDKGLRFVVVVLAALVFGWAPGALAYPTSSGPQDAGVTADKKGELIAQRRRRRRRRRPKRVRRRRRPRRARPAPKAAPAPATPRRSAPAAAAPAAAAASPGEQGLRRGARVEFDGRLVQGQTAKSGAIYLFARKRSELRSMVKERKSYRREIVRSVYPDYGSGE